MTACLYCGGAAFDPLHDGVRDRLGHVPGERRFVRCRACGSSLLDPLPAEEELPGFYPPVYSFTTEQTGTLKQLLANLEHRLFFGPQYREQVRRVLETCGRSPRGRTLLDVGCGRGLRLTELKRAGFRPTGLDFQADAVRYIRDTLKIPAEVGGTDDLPKLFPPASFDVVTAFYLLEHVRDVRRVMADCLGALKPGGWFVAAVPLADSLQARLFGKRWIHVTEAPRHLSLPTRAGLRTAAEAAGFEAIHFRPDAMLNAAGPAASSIVSGATLTHVYGGGKWIAIAKRLFGGALTFAALPLCMLEHAACGRMSHGILFARKPGGDHAAA
jgi:SAM-dependent methyltransferase